MMTLPLLVALALVLPSTWLRTTCVAALPEDEEEGGASPQVPSTEGGRGTGKSSVVPVYRSPSPPSSPPPPPPPPLPLPPSPQGIISSLLVPPTQGPAGPPSPPSIPRVDLPLGCRQVVPDSVFCGGVAQFPRVLPPTLTTLEVRGSQLEILRPKILGRLPFLETLTLADGVLASVKRGAFEGLSSMESLSLAQNRLSVISWDVFADTPRLALLTLNHNRIEGKYLKGHILVLPQLSYLSLDHNPLGHLQDRTFMPLKASPIQHLSLRFCQLEEVDPGSFLSLHMLEQLDLAGNPKLTDDKLFLILSELANSSKSGVRTLSLEHNHMQAIPTRSLQLLQETLETLKFSNNSLRELLPQVLPPLPRLRRLVLADCGIVLIHPEAFDNLTSLRYLDLSFNRLSSVPDGIQLRLLEALSLKGNIPGGDHENGDDAPVIIGDSSNMVVLQVGSQRGSFLLGGIHGFESLRQLDLSDMPLFSLGPGNLLGCCAVLTRLMLRNTSLSMLEKEVFLSVPELRTLDLGFNNLQEESFVALPFAPFGRLTHLYLQHNHISALRNKDAFLLPEMIHLDLSYNLLSVVETEVFEGMTKLRYLDLSHNFLHQLSALPLPTLEHLDISSNQLTSIPVEIMEMKGLRSLHLADLPLECTCDLWTFLGRLKSWEVILSGLDHSAAICVNKSSSRLSSESGSPCRDGHASGSDISSPVPKSSSSSLAIGLSMFLLLVAGVGLAVGYRQKLWTLLKGGRCCSPAFRYSTYYSREDQGEAGSEVVRVHG
ncbi:podocan-like [Oratosquilla oratoria]|uniref:podocan-like n=1 Tax=Oratosquilla oratoria TaxID=337810 RepID=UPI003F772FEA